MNVTGFLQALAAVSWLGVAGSLRYGAVRASRRLGRGGAVTLFAGSLIAASVFTTAAASVVFVPPEERGVVPSALPGDEGVKREALQPGLQWIAPFFQNVIVYPISRQTYTMSGTVGEGQVFGDDSIRARTSDGQEIFIDASVIYAIDPAQVVTVHIQWQNRYRDELVRATAHGIIRDVASRYGVKEIVSDRRTELETAITDQLTSKFTENGLVLVDFVLRDIHFSQQYAAAVEQKQVAEQAAQRAALVVQRKQYEAEQTRVEAQGIADAAVIQARGAAEATIIAAEAQAQALALLSQALKDNPDLITFRYVEKLAPEIRTILAPSETPFGLPTLTQTARPTAEPTTLP